MKEVRKRPQEGVVDGWCTMSAMPVHSATRKETESKRSTRGSSPAPPYLSLALPNHTDHAHRRGTSVPTDIDEWLVNGRTPRTQCKLRQATNGWATPSYANPHPSTLRCLHTRWLAIRARRFAHKMTLSGSTGVNFALLGSSKFGLDMFQATSIKFSTYWNMIDSALGL